MKTAQLITERHSAQIRGTLSCFDRINITGTLPDICHAGAMTSTLYRENIMVFEYPKFVDPLRLQLSANAASLAKAAGIEVEFIQKTKSFRKEDRLKAIIEGRGSKPGLVHVFSAMENCTCFKPWHDRQTGNTFLRTSPGRCLHFYFYFIDELLGLLHVRVPTWAPFRLQVCLNGHNWLASLLRRGGVGFKMVDNAFVECDDFPKAQALADGIDPEVLHRRLDHYARLACPFAGGLFPNGWHWSLSQVEYATDVVFKRPEGLAPLYEALVSRAVHEVKVDNIATFLGHNGLSPNYAGEGGSRFNLTVEGTRLRHSLGDQSIKMYDKFGVILRVETTSNDVTFFKHHRNVEHRDGSATLQNAPVKKTIHSLGVLRELMGAANRRYLEFISNLEDDSQGRKELGKVSQRVEDEAGRSYRGINFFLKEDVELLLAVLRPEHLISGVTARLLRGLLKWKSAKVSRAIRRLREHGLLKKVGGTFKYYLTKAGSKVFLAAMRIREQEIIPALG